MRGGRSAQYSERRAARGAAAARAPEWSDATSAAILQTLEDANESATGKREVPLKKVVGLLGSEDGVRTLISYASSKVGVAERPLISAIVMRAHQKVGQGTWLKPHSAQCEC